MFKKIALLCVNICVHIAATYFAVLWSMFPLSFRGWHGQINDPFSECSAASVLRNNKSDFFSPVLQGELLSEEVDLQKTCVCT